MKSFIAIAPLVAAANAGLILNGAVRPYTQNGQVAGPLTPAHGDFVATVRGARPISLEGFSEDVNQDGFVDPIGQVAPIFHAPAVYAHPAPFYHAAPVVHTSTYHAAPVVQTVQTVAAPAVQTVAAPTVTYTAGLTAPLTYTHGLTHPINYAAGPAFAQQALLSPQVYASAPFVGAPLAAPWGLNPFAATPIIAKAEAEIAEESAVIEA